MYIDERSQIKLKVIVCKSRVRLCSMMNTLYEDNDRFYSNLLLVRVKSWMPAFFKCFVFTDADGRVCLHWLLRTIYINDSSWCEFRFSINYRTAHRIHRSYQSFDFVVSRNEKFNFWPLSILIHFNSVLFTFIRIIIYFIFFWIINLDMKAAANVPGMFW